MKPDDLTLWFDMADFRLCAVPPVIHLLRHGSLTREEILDGLERRFGIAQRKGDDLIDQQRQLGYLVDSMDGHKRIYEIDLRHAMTAVWFERLRAKRISS